MNNWQAIGQLITAALIVSSGPIIIFLVKKASL